MWKLPFGFCYGFEIEQMKLPTTIVIDENCSFSSYKYYAYGLPFQKKRLEQRAVEEGEGSSLVNEDEPGNTSTPQS